MNLQLEGKTCLVTGASVGCGDAVSRVLAREGAQVLMTARRTDRMETISDGIEQAGGQRPYIIAGDIMDPVEIERICSDAVKMAGPVDILVNAAGGSRPIGVEAGDDVWEEAFDLNFHSCRRFTHALLPSMRARGFGRVIGFSGSMEPRTLNAAIAAKAAIHLWAKGLSCDVAKEGVTVNCIAPGRIKSEQILEKLHPTESSRQAFIDANIPIGYFGEAEDVGNAVAFLCSPLASYITGSVLPVDGGMHAFAH